MHCAATKIQTLFRKYHEKDLSSRFTPALKKQILEHMTRVNDRISLCYSAALVNEHIGTEIFKATGNDTRVLRAKQQLNKITQGNNSLSFLHAIIQDEKKHFATQKYLLRLLSLAYQERDMVCDNMAVYLAVLLKNDPILASIRGEIYVCECQGHVFVSIGHPREKSSLIVDPWIRYLDLPPTAGYRDRFSDHEDPERKRGFLGNVKTYTKFLHDHPNAYVDNSEPLDFEIIPQYTIGINGITPNMIENPVEDPTAVPPLSESDIAPIRDRRVLSDVLCQAIDYKQPEIVQMLVNHPNIDLARTNSKGMKPYEQALSNGNTDVVEILETALKKKAEEKARAATAITPLQQIEKADQSQCCIVQ